MSTSNLPASHAASYVPMPRAASRISIRPMQPSHSTFSRSEPYPIFQWTLRLIALTALVTSSYLAWVAFNAGNVAGCGSGSTFDCSHVLSSRWSSLLGIPVSFPAVVLYTLVSVLLMVPAHWQITSQRIAQYRWPLVVLAAFLAGLGGLWFIGLQVFVLQHLCAYCLVVHGCGLALAVLVATHKLTRPYVKLRLVAAAALAVLSFVAAQIMLPAAEKFEMVEYESTPAAEVDSPFSGTAPLEPFGEFTSPIAPSNADRSDTQQGSVNEGNADSRTDARSLDNNGTGNTKPAEIFESPLQAPSPDSSSRVKPQPHSWLYGLHPALLLTAQVGVGTPTQGAQQTADEQTADEQTAEQKTEQKADAPVERKLVSILNGVQLDVSQWPLLGDVNAKYFIVEMLDYTCGHCQNTHPAVHGAMQAYGGQLAVVVLPVPLDTKCNPHVNSTAAQHSQACELAKLAIAVWHVAPERFTEFHNWLLESKPNYTRALAHAETLIDRQKLQAELQSNVPAAFIKANVDLYKRASAGAVPKILFPRTSAVGEMRSKDSLVSLIEKEVVRQSK